MNRWQAYTLIVRAFLQRGHPVYALLALGLIILPPIVAGVVVYSLGQPAIEVMTELKMR